jgi:hypothetical protein
VGIAITPNTPSSGGGAVAMYGVSPTLPDGLTLDAATGVIHGVPATVTPAATYTITGTNSAGSTTAQVRITVTAALEPPSGLTYSVNPAEYTVGVPIAPNAPTSGGGPVSSYAVAPALPAGLELDAATGVIGGTPQVAAAMATYTVTATNPAGSAAVGVTVTVRGTLPPPRDLAYQASPAFYTAGVAIVPNAPSSTGGPVDAYAVSPSLPEGLVLDARTGVISGVPAAVTASAGYTVTATNGAGSATTGLRITVGPPGRSARFISASPVMVGHRTVQVALPPAWRAGDVLVTMLFTPTGAPTLPAGWRHAGTYNYVKVAGPSETAVTITTVRGLVAGTIAAYRGVDTRPGYLPGSFASSAFPEYGGATAVPGTYYPPDGSQVPRFGPGSCNFSLGPAIAGGSLAVATYQSEGSDSFPVDPHYVAAGALVERSLTYASMVNPETGNTDHFRLGFFDAPLGDGDGTGFLYFGTRGSGGGERADTLQPYTGPVAWFSQLILSGAEQRGPDLTIMPPGTPVDATVTVVGSRASEAPVELSSDSGVISGPTYPTPTTWQATVSGLALGPTTITVTSGIEAVTATVVR